MNRDNWSPCGAEDGRELDRLHPLDCGCEACIADKAECFAEHSHMAIGETCTCGFKAVPLEGEGKPVCQYACEHDCTLVGHTYEAMRFLNQCLEQGIVKTAVEEDPDYTKFLTEVSKTMVLLRERAKK